MLTNVSVTGAARSIFVSISSGNPLQAVRAGSAVRFAGSPVQNAVRDDRPVRHERFIAIPAPGALVARIRPTEPVVRIYEN